ncbi:MAG: flagellar hook-basal body complex protein FliE [Candidatus Binataceae bacterium]
MTIPSIANLPDVALRSSQPAPSPSGSGFGAAVEKVDAALKQANVSTAQYAAGHADITDAVLSAEKASVQFDFLMAVRKEALAAYQQMMNLAY